MRSKDWRGAVALVDKRGDMRVDETPHSVEEWQEIERETGWVMVREWRSGWRVFVTYKGNRELHPRRQSLFTGKMV